MCMVGVYWFAGDCGSVAMKEGLMLLMLMLDSCDEGYLCPRPCPRLRGVSIFTYSGTVYILPLARLLRPNSEYTNPQPH